jgi:hypothetical protein
MSGDELILKYKTFVFGEFIKCCQLLSIEEQIHFTDTLQKILPLIYRDENNPQIWIAIEQELYWKFQPNRPQTIGLNRPHSIGSNRPQEIGPNRPHLF